MINLLASHPPTRTGSHLQRWPCKLKCHYLRCIGKNPSFLWLTPECLMPHLKLIFTWRNVSELEVTIGVGHCIIRMFGNDKPTRHPRMGIARDFDHFRVSKSLLQHFLEL